MKIIRANTVFISRKVNLRFRSTKPPPLTTIPRKNNELTPECTLQMIYGAMMGISSILRPVIRSFLYLVPFCVLISEHRAKKIRKRMKKQSGYRNHFIFTYSDDIRFYHLIIVFLQLTRINLTLCSFFYIYIYVHLLLLD